MNKVSSNIFVVIVFYNPIEEDIKHAQMLSERYDGVVVDNSSSPSCDSSMFSRFKYIANILRTTRILVLLKHKTKALRRH